ncbi:neural-cadherin-like [Saccoglossus kowalevskii]|uniref:Neural-cadherin-like n=1 Tax=Saccoglossus kowalevskii TaxID=10224 RepID=A0ABM0GYJ8_SACKO|nr:PREDICTED: neural-cadherin-like [Saccoglossus kowalevskii]
MSDRRHIHTYLLLSVVLSAILIVRGAAPEFDKDLYLSSITEEDENVPVYVTTVGASDPDGDTDIWYSLQNTSQHYFSIDPITGAIEAIKPLDRETTPVYHLVAIATDDGGQGESGYTDVIVELLDINDNSPLFPYEPYIGSVIEHSPTGTSVMRVLAEDLDDINTDRNARIEYTIIENALWNGTDAIFEINSATSEISILVSDLDREEVEIYEIVVEARDGGSQSATATATVVIQDINDMAPKFSHTSYFTTVNEDAEVASTVYSVTATDRDTDFILTYYIVGGNENDTFDIENNNNVGVVTLMRELDYEDPYQPRRYNLQLGVSDGIQTDISTLLIVIEDINELSPVFSPDTYAVNFPENVTIGTELGTVTATDDNGDVMYSIDPISDPLGQFEVDQHTGTVTTAAELDREYTSIHTLYIVATDQGKPTLSSTAEFIVTLEDVNDNAPMFAEDYRPILIENSLPQQDVFVVSAIDADTAVNGPPYTYTVDNSNNIDDYFDYRQVNNTLEINTTSVFDREEQAYYYMHIIIADVHGLSDTSTLTIEIGDLNDNAHVAGVTQITVYQYRGRGASRVIGSVFAPDPDDYANDDKMYIFNGTSDYFKVDNTTGTITITDERTPEGSYQYQVAVEDNEHDTQICDVIIDVIYIFDDAVYDSASLRLNDITPEEFIMIPQPGTNSPLQNFTDILADILSIDVIHINVFSVVLSGVRLTDVRYNIRGYRPEALDAIIVTNIDRFKDEANLDITLVNINDCMDETECEGGSCSNVFRVDDSQDALVESGSASLSVSITTSTTAECLCQSKICKKTTCDPNPCRNGGQCIATEYSYRCNCPSGYTGPQCQDISRSFFGDGYAWYSALQSCRESHTSIEFLTSEDNGLLMYNGPMSSYSVLQPDYIAVGLVNGLIQLSIDLGSGMVHMEIPESPRLDDGKWHRVDIYRNGKDVELMVDHCATSVITEFPTLSSEDTSSCLATSTVPGDSELLNLNTALQIGGVSQEPAFSYPPDIGIDLTDRFHGCIRNVNQDGEVYDLGNPAQEVNSVPGCVAADVNCFDNEEPLCINGTCMADFNTAYCICDSGYYGDRCSILAPEYDFADDSYVTYSLNGNLSLVDRASDYQIMFRTRDANGMIWRISSEEGRDGLEYIIIALINGTIQVHYDLGDGLQIIALDGMTVNNGVWHTVHVLRQRNHFLVLLDDGGDACHQTEYAGAVFRELKVDTESLVIGGNLDSGTLSHNFNGCLSDARINNVYIGFDGDIDGTIAIPSDGVTEGCYSYVCQDVECQDPLECQDMWREYECACNLGEYESDGQCIEIDECADAPCLNDGNCQDGTTSFTCNCNDQYWGHICQYESACATDPCENNGECEDILSGFKCQCKPGYIGDTCNMYNKCYDEPCENGGSCTPIGDSDYVCDCEFGYTGNECEETDECAVNPCINGGTCVDGEDSYTCECPGGFFGDECRLTDFCYSEPCINGNCTLVYGLFIPTGYECNCEIGWLGETCSEKDYCNPNPCKNDGLCEMVDEGFSCTCDWSWEGDTCEDYDNITARITVGVTLIGAFCVIVPLIIALLCARKYEKKQRKRNSHKLSDIAGSEDGNAVQSQMYKQNNDYSEIYPTQSGNEENGTANKGFVVYDNAEGLELKDNSDSGE